MASYGTSKGGGWKSGKGTPDQSRSRAAVSAEGKRRSGAAPKGVGAKLQVGPSKKGGTPKSTKLTSGNTKMLPRGPNRGDFTGKSARPGRPGPTRLTTAPKNNLGTPTTTKQVPAPAVQPFLNPTQQAAWSTYQANYGYGQGAITRKEGDLTFNTNAGLAANQRTHDINTSQTNQNLAARGLFQSSIRDGDLNDLNATLAIKNNILNTNMRSTMIDLGSQYDKNVTNYGITQNMYNDLAVGNAQAVPPSTKTTTVTTPGTPGNQLPKPPTQQSSQNPAHGYVQGLAGAGVPWAQSVLTNPNIMGHIANPAAAYVDNAAAAGVPWAQNLQNNPNVPK